MNIYFTYSILNKNVVSQDEVDYFYYEYFDITKHDIFVFECVAGARMVLK